MCLGVSVACLCEEGQIGILMLANSVGTACHGSS